MKNNKYAVFIFIVFLIVVLFLCLLFKSIISSPPQTAMELKEEGSRKATNIIYNSQQRGLLKKNKRYDVFKPKAKQNTEKDSLEYRLRSGEIVI